MSTTDVTKGLRETVGNMPRRGEYKPGDTVRLGGKVATVSGGLPDRADALLGSLKVHACRRSHDEASLHLSATLAAAIEAEVAERVAEALRSQLPEDAPDGPGAWQGRTNDVGRREVWDPEKRSWSAGDGVAVVHANHHTWVLTEALYALCTEPPELTMPMRARREWRRMERLAAKWIPAEYPGTVEGLKQRRTALRNLLKDSGEPL